MLDKTKIDVEVEATRVESPPTLFEGKEVKGRRPFLGWMAVLEGSFPGETFYLHEGRNVIGSSPSCDIQITDKGIEDQHLSIRYGNKKWMATDFDTNSGTFLNGKRMYRGELQDADKIKIGKALLQIKIL